MLHKKMVIKKIDKEGNRVKTFYLDSGIEAEPGQFVMVWIPELDEKPFCISGDNPLKISVANVGIFSNKMHELNEGDPVWIRGPFGKGFKLHGKKAVIVGGGYGVAPLKYLAEKALKKGIKVKFVMGAKTCNELMNKPSVDAITTCTDDGSEGKKGLVTKHLVELLEKNKPDCVYACGPERMLVEIMKICSKHKVECQLSLERYMKCGFGICGQCSLGGFMVCRDGPVFTGKELEKIDDFGKRKLDATGTHKRI